MSGHQQDEKEDPVAVEQKSLTSHLAGEREEELWGPKPTDEELETLKKVPDSLSWSTWLIALVELGERFTYFGISGPIQNYMQKTRVDGHGGLGLGQQTATALSYFFQFWCYVTPVLGAIVADKYVGKYKAICIFSGIYSVGNLILFVTSLPISLNHNGGLGGLVTAMVVIGTGTGGIKSNVGTMIADQYTNTKQYVKELKSGEKVIVDPTITIQKIFMCFYCAINSGSLSSIPATFLERDVDFWAAYLMPFCFFFVGILALVIGKNIYIKRPPQGSVIPDTFKILYISARNGFSIEAAKPSMREVAGRPDVGWTDLFVDEVRRAIYACKVFAFFPMFWLVYGQMVNNFVSQTGQMTLHGMPNDVMQAFDSISVLVFVPIFNVIVYPGLRKIGIMMRPITRIACGLFMCAVAMAYAAIVQHLIYSAGPCYEYPLQCSASKGGTVPNDVHVAVQAPSYALIAIGEILAGVTGLEYAYTKAPANMKSFIQAMFLLTNAVGAVVGIALSSVSKNPKLIWMFVGLSGSTAVVAVIFYLVFCDLDAKEEELNAIDADYVQELNKQLKEQKYENGYKHDDDDIESKV